MPGSVLLKRKLTWRHHLAAVPAEAVGEAVHRHHVAEVPAGKASAGDIDKVKPARLWLDLRLRSHPPEDLLRISQEREHGGARRWDVRLAADDECLLHRFPQRFSYPPTCAAGKFLPTCGRNVRAPPRSKVLVLRGPRPVDDNPAPEGVRSM